MLDVVFNDGNPKSKIICRWGALLVKIRGLPFVGRAGQLLDKCYHQNDRKKVYISNIVNYRPPEKEGLLRRNQNASVYY